MVSGDNPALITGGVGEALIATATGFMCSSISFSCAQLFSNRLDGILTDVENVCTLLINKSRGKDE